MQIHNCDGGVPRPGSRAGLSGSGARLWVRCGRVAAARGRRPGRQPGVRKGFLGASQRLATGTSEPALSQRHRRTQHVGTPLWGFTVVSPFLTPGTSLPSPRRWESTCASSGWKTTPREPCDAAPVPSSRAELRQPRGRAGPRRAPLARAAACVHPGGRGLK